ncbi:MAG: 1,2-phenylacetyl-CoA epoxidase subunit PaaB [Pseudomonadales bacterium]
MSAESLMPLYEVFVRSRRGLDHVHVGSLHAPDGETALEYARETYMRRNEGASIWVVATEHIVASQESDVPSFYDPMDDKPYRHATYYELPDDIKNM